VPLNQSIPDPALDLPHKQELQYYQWVPIVLTIQAFFFMIPGEGLDFRVLFIAYEF